MFLTILACQRTHTSTSTSSLTFYTIFKSQHPCLLSNLAISQYHTHCCTKAFHVLHPSLLSLRKSFKHHLGLRTIATRRTWWRHSVILELVGLVLLKVSTPPPSVGWLGWEGTYQVSTSYYSYRNCDGLLLVRKKSSYRTRVEPGMMMVIVQKEAAPQGADPARRSCK